MLLVLIITLLFVVIVAYVYLTLMVQNANMIIGFIKQIPVGIMVCKRQRKLNKIFYLILGVYNEISNTTFICTCQAGWLGIYCETKINSCANVTCLNKGVCQSSLLNYTCQCLGDQYSGQHCEIVSSKTAVLQIFSKSFAYIVIIAMITVAMFITILDVLKYFFGIDPVGDELKKIEQKNKIKKKPPVIIRYIYVNAPPTESTEQVNLTILETNV